MNGRQVRSGGEAASTISLTVLGITIVAMIMLVVGTQTMSSIFTTKQKQEKSAGMAAADSGIEKLRVALQAGLADETDHFTLNEGDLQRLVQQQEGATVVASDPTWLASFGMKPQLVDDQFTVREEAGDSVGYWHVYNIVRPHFRPARSSDVVFYVRAWATSADATPTLTIRPKVFRVEFRPGLFSDYQYVSNAPFWVRGNTNYTINGPIHSNGYEPDATFRNMVDASGNPLLGHAIFMDKPPDCREGARFSTSRGGDIHVAGADCADARNTAQNDAREVSLLGVTKVFKAIADRCNRVGVVCPDNATHYNVRLNGSTVEVDGTPVGNEEWIQGPDSRSLTLLLSGDVTVRGTLDSKAAFGTDGDILRLTIANRRVNSVDRPPNIILAAGAAQQLGVNSNSVNRDSVGLITEGNVVLRMREPGKADDTCLRRVQVAAIAASGAVTIPTEWVTPHRPPVALGGRECPETLRIQGSLASHGQFVASLAWTDDDGSTKTVGYPAIDMHYERRLYKVAPPFYPTTLPWAVTTVREADGRCLLGAGAADPFCDGAG